MDFGKVITALVTPFKSNGEIDFTTFEKLLEKQIESQIDSVVIFGTTGEGPTLSFDEKKLLLEKAVNLSKNRIKIIANTGTNNTIESLDLTRMAKACKADGVLAIVPYYNRPEKRGIIEHFHQIASVGLPLIFYHHPKRTGIKLDFETISKIANHPLVCGIKECSSDLELISKMKMTIPHLKIYSGNDDQLIQEKPYGLDGVISVLAQLYARPFIELFYEQNSSHLEKINNLFKTIFLEVNPQGIKAALSLLGYESMNLRLPLVSVEKETKVAIEAAINQSLLNPIG